MSPLSWVDTLQGTIQGSFIVGTFNSISSFDRCIALRIVLCGWHLSGFYRLSFHALDSELGCKSYKEVWNNIYMLFVYFRTITCVLLSVLVIELRIVYLWAYKPLSIITCVFFLCSYLSASFVVCHLNRYD